MKEIKILHIFPKLLCLYGEYANISVLKHYLEKNSFTVTITDCEEPLPPLNDFDMIYMGSGTEDNILHAITLLYPYKEAIQKSIEGGRLWLITGNAQAIFGRCITYEDGRHCNALDIFPFTVTCTRKRFSGDVLSSAFAGKALIGYINNSYIFEGITSPLTRLTLNPCLGNNKITGDEGLLFKSFYSTALTGPLLIKNPHFLEFFMEAITDSRLIIPENEPIKKAYASSLRQLKKRSSSSAD